MSSIFDWGEAGRLETQEVVAVQVQGQSADEPGKADVADEVQTLLEEFPLARGRSAFGSIWPSTDWMKPTLIM